MFAMMFIYFIMMEMLIVVDLVSPAYLEGPVPGDETQTPLPEDLPSHE